jgi:CRP-like cAMP-binding protein
VALAGTAHTRTTGRNGISPGATCTPVLGRQRPADTNAYLVTATNHLIELLPARSRVALLRIADSVPLALEQVLCEAGKPAQHVYFPTSGFISLIVPVDHHAGLEVSMVGSEGMLGAHLALGIQIAPQRALVQGVGSAIRIETRPFMLELERSPALLRGLQRYLYVLMSQFAVAAPCLRFHLTGPRLARWLLMSHDRAGADSFRITHEFLGYMLGMRRAGITAAAGTLQSAGLIEYSRGNIKVLDRKGLERAACSCYAADEQAYQRFLH